MTELLKNYVVHQTEYENAQGKVKEWIDEGQIEMLEL
jgi:hypothetical protein